MRIHISLNVESLARSKDFYTRLFGREPSKLRDDYLNFRPDEPPIHLALQTGDGGRRGDAGHFGIELPGHDDLRAWRERLEAAGVAFVPEDDAACCYARADKLWLTDPDGYRWEIWVRTGEHDAMGEVRRAVSETEAESEACC